MGEYKKSNQDVQIGDIFVTGGASLYDECGSADSIYQVTGKRGKTLAVLQQIKVKPYIDETCDRARGVVKFHPISDSFVGDEVLTRAYIDKDGKTSLWEVVHNNEKRPYSFHRYETYGASCSGQYGFDYWKRYDQGLPLEKE